MTISFLETLKNVLSKISRIICMNWMKLWNKTWLREFVQTCRRSKMISKLKTVTQTRQRGFPFPLKLSGAVCHLPAWHARMTLVWASFLNSSISHFTILMKTWHSVILWASERDPSKFQTKSIRNSNLKLDILATTTTTCRITKSKPTISDTFPTRHQTSTISWVWLKDLVWRSKVKVLLTSSKHMIRRPRSIQTCLRKFFSQLTSSCLMTLLSTRGTSSISSEYSPSSVVLHPPSSPLEASLASTSTPSYSWDRSLPRFSPLKMLRKRKTRFKGQVVCCTKYNSVPWTSSAIRRILYWRYYVVSVSTSTLPLQIIKKKFTKLVTRLSTENLILSVS